MKKFLVCLVVLFFLLTNPTLSHAQAEPDTSTQSTSDENSFEVDPTQDLIDEATPKVKISFPGLTGEGYKVCLESDTCLNTTDLKRMSIENVEKFVNRINLGLEDKEINTKKFKDLPAGNSIEVCGAGKNALKTNDCTADKSWFHAGNIYVVTVFQKQGDKWFSRARGGFYVSHHAPTVVITPRNNRAPENFEMSLTQDVLLKSRKKNDNNYQIIFEGPGIKEEKCLPGGDQPFTDSPGNYKLSFPTDKWKNNPDNFVDQKPVQGLFPGRYIFKINDQTSEGGVSTNDCKGGFTHFHYICDVSSTKPTACKEVKDPNGSDGKEVLALLSIINGETKNGSRLPCNKDRPTVTNPLDCNKIETAIGTIELNPAGFISRMFSLVLTFAGIGALILIIYSGFRLMVSRGNKEVIQGARETLTAAIVGLLFIIFSLVILSVITLDILKIPGFTQ